MSNPFSLTFGKKPSEYITRHDKIGMITSAFLETPPMCQTYMITGVRGSGKTVLMTALSQEFADKGWVCVDLNSSLNLLDDLSYRLNDVLASFTSVLKRRGGEISVLGFAAGVGAAEERDSVSRCESVLNEIKKKGKKLLITIDEVRNDESMTQFASQFQIWLRKDYPIFLLMTGLPENINAIQNNSQLTFLLRSPKCMLDALGISQVARQYESALNVSEDTAIMLAKETKGYAFAFQALGFLYFNNTLQSELYKELDNYLDVFVYRKIWDSLSKQEKRIMLQLSDEKEIKVQAICKGVGMSSSSFSKYRERLLAKGLISTSQYGYIGVSLPRFCKIINYYV